MQGTRFVVRKVSILRGPSIILLICGSCGVDFGESCCNYGYRVLQQRTTFRFCDSVAVLIALGHRNGSVVSRGVAPA